MIQINFVDTGLDDRILKSIPVDNCPEELMKSVRDRTKLVPKVVVDKNGVSRKVFVNPDDNRTSKDKVISVKEQSSKFRKGTVIEAPVGDSKTNKLKTVTCVVKSVSLKSDKHNSYCTSIIEDKNGKKYRLNLSKGKVKKCSKKNAETFLGREIFPTEFFYKSANESKPISEKQAMDLYKKEGKPTETFDEFSQKNFFISDGYTETKYGYMTKDGDYTPERQELHDAIVAELLDKAQDPPEGSPPVCYLFGGGSASGKSSVVNPLMESIAKESGVEFVRVDSDEIKKQIPEYKSFQDQNMKKAAYRVHNESSDIANMANKELMEAGKCFAFDGTMKSYEKYSSLIDELHKHGYKVIAIGVDIPTEDALQRSADRAKTEGREVPKGIIIGSHGGFANTFPKIQSKVDDYRLYDNSQPRGESPTLICSKSKGITDDNLWARFQKKGQDYINFKSKKGDKQHGK